MPKKKSISRKKKSAAKRTSGRKAAAKRAATRKSAKKATPKRASAARKKRTTSRTAPRPVPLASRPQAPSNGQAPQLAADDEHGPMHIASHKPAPAYAQMHSNDWAGKPPTHNIPIPKH